MKLHFVSLMLVASASCLLEKHRKIFTWWEANFPLQNEGSCITTLSFTPLWAPVSKHLKSQLHLNQRKAICRVYGRKMYMNRPLLNDGAEFSLLQAGEVCACSDDNICTSVPVIRVISGMKSCCEFSHVFTWQPMSY